MKKTSSMIAVLAGALSMAFGGAEPSEETINTAITQIGHPAHDKFPIGVGRTVPSTVVAP